MDDCPGLNDQQIDVSKCFMNGGLCVPYSITSMGQSAPEMQRDGQLEADSPEFKVLILLMDQSQAVAPWGRKFYAGFYKFAVAPPF